MQTLSNGVFKPEDGDTGNVWADALESNAEFLNNLKTEVDNLTITDINRLTTTIDSANWSVDPDGKGYIQTVSMPAGASLDLVNLRTRITSGPNVNVFIHPTIIPNSLTNFDIVVNDSTLNLEILYV